MEGERDKPSTPSQLVTAYGTYATQSAFTATPISKEEKVLAKNYTQLQATCVWQALHVPSHHNIVYIPVQASTAWLSFGGTVLHSVSPGLYSH